jgi:aryl-alcohol dehydrogenase-like predicted oxidoreductase
MVPEDEVFRIIAFARQAGVTVIDTAPAYGASEAVIGKAIATSPSSYNRPWRVVTKLPPLRESSTRQLLASAERYFADSYERLGRRIYGVILHDPADLESPHASALVDLLRAWKTEGRVERIGTSVYDAWQIDRALRFGGLDLVQLPISIFDQRLEATGHLAELKRNGWEVHARSVFLQGLLLMRESELPSGLRVVAPHTGRFCRAAEKSGMSLLAASLGYVKSLEAIDHIVIGVHSLRHLVECIKGYELAGLLPEYKSFAIDDLNIIDPRRWTCRS